jgi:pimeloyl-ACP methyl ester carboxylesterase
VLRTERVDPFTICVPQPVLDDLRARLTATRWPDELPDTGWVQGTSLDYLVSLASTWAHGFDWRAQEDKLNQLDHYRTEIGGLGIHFVHEHGDGPAPFPLVLTHGWPSSFVEYLDLIPLLTDPAAHGGDAGDAFDVVVPSLPGYGFSDRPCAAGMVNVVIAEMWVTLMARLGYRRFGAHGGDIGAGVTTRLGRHFADRLVGIHLGATGFSVPPKPWSPAEREYFAGGDRWEAEEGAYSNVHATKPQSLGYALSDSPVGLAAWIVEKFRAWSDCGGELESRFSRELLLTNLTIYWVTETITSSLRLYWDYRHHGTPLVLGDRIQTPTGFAIFANEFRCPVRPPRELAERYYNVERWTELPRGGHFPALEEPELLAEEIRAFFRPLRGT